MRRRCAIFVASLFVFTSPVVGQACPLDTLTIADPNIPARDLAVAIGSSSFDVLSMVNPEQRASYNLSEGRIAARARRVGDWEYGHPYAHATTVVHDVYTLIGPSLPDPITFTARLSITATGDGEHYYGCQDSGLCLVPAGGVGASITEGVANSASYSSQAQGIRTISLTVTISANSGQTFDLRLGCTANADFAAGSWPYSYSNRTADVAAVLDFPDLPEGYAVVSCQGYRSWPDVPVCIATGYQSLPRIAADGVGGAIVTWTDGRDPGVLRAYAQRIGAGGVPQWTADGLALCASAGSQAIPAIASDGAGGAIIVWHDSRSGSSEIYAQRFNAAGVPLWTANGVLLRTGPGSAYFHTVVSDGGSGAIVAWSDTRGSSSGTGSDIYAQRIDSTGGIHWATNGVALCLATGEQQFPSPPSDVPIVSDGAGGAIVSWWDDRSGMARRAFAQRVSAAGVPLWTTDGVALCSGPGDQFPQGAVTDGLGGAIISWSTGAQRVSATGALQWSTTGITNFGGNFGALASDGAGGAIVAWIGGSMNRVYAQRVGADGASCWPGSGVELSTMGAIAGEYPVAIAGDGVGGAIVAWVGWDDVTRAVFAQRVGPTGLPQWPVKGIELCGIPGDKYYPTIAPDGVGGAIVAWQDQRAGQDSDIYAQRVALHSIDLANPVVHLLTPNGGESAFLGDQLAITWHATDDVGVQSVDVYLSRSGPSGPWETLVQSAPNSGSYWWTVEGAQSNFEAFIRLDARDNADKLGTDISDAGFAITDRPVPTLVEQFRLEDRAEGVALHWSLADPASLASLTPQRGASETGEWIEVQGTVTVDGRMNVLVDRDATAGSTNWYRLAGMLRDGGQMSAPPLSIVHAGVTALALDRLAPNPVASTTQVSYALPRASRVRLSLVDVQGREVVILADGEREAGRHVASLNVSDLRAGLYFLRLRAGGTELKQRLIVIR